MNFLQRLDEALAEYQEHYILTTVDRDGRENWMPLGWKTKSESALTKTPPLGDDIVTAILSHNYRDGDEYVAIDVLRGDESSIEVRTLIAKIRGQFQENIFTEGWEELGVKDPGVKWPEPTRYTDEAISAKAVPAYGLGSSKAWDIVRHHHLYIQMVRDEILSLSNQIEGIKARIKDPESIRDKLTSALSQLGSMGDDSREIAKAAGWGDPNDIIISAQRHPFSMELLKKREILSQALKKRA